MELLHVHQNVQQATLSFRFDPSSQVKKKKKFSEYIVVI